ncbi:MAG: hypothetical protein MZV70_62775 [Desulfobacterales bacterium]|nr:hypothetical protein [Desulfobacterales bacterium]
MALQDQVRGEPAEVGPARVPVPAAGGARPVGAGADTSSTSPASSTRRRWPMVQTLPRGAALRGCCARRSSPASASPLVFGEPDEWMALLVEALLRRRAGPHAGAAQRCAAQALRGGAGDGRARSTAQPFEWIADARHAPRPGARGHRQRPLLLGAVRAACRRSCIEAPADLRDLVWMPAQFTSPTAARRSALIPTRYPGSEAERRTR